jgi:hypothetical protein
VEVKAGELTRQLPEALDLCQECEALFLDFLKSGHHANHAGPVAASRSRSMFAQRGGSIALKRSRAMCRPNEWGTARCASRPPEHTAYQETGDSTPTTQCKRPVCTVKGARAVSFRRPCP